MSKMWFIPARKRYSVAPLYSKLEVSGFEKRSAENDSRLTVASESEYPVKAQCKLMKPRSFHICQEPVHAFERSQKADHHDSTGIFGLHWFCRKTNTKRVTDKRDLITCDVILKMSL